MLESNFRGHTWSALGQIDNPRPHALCLGSIAEVTPVENVFKSFTENTKTNTKTTLTNIKTNKQTESKFEVSSGLSCLPAVYLGGYLSEITC